MTVFSSKYRKYVTRGTDWVVKFNNHTFSTDDEVLIGKLRKHPVYGKKFIEATKPKTESNVISGIRGSGTQPILDRDLKLIRLGELSRILKKDGSFRKDALPEEVKEYKELKDLFHGAN